MLANFVALQHFLVNLHLKQDTKKRNFCETFNIQKKLQFCIGGKGVIICTFTSTSISY